MGFQLACAYFRIHPWRVQPLRTRPIPSRKHERTKTRKGPDSNLLAVSFSCFRAVFGWIAYVFQDTSPKRKRGLSLRPSLTLRAKSGSAIRLQNGLLCACSEYTPPSAPIRAD